jgi:uptake hydrogenase large subunit
MTPEGRICIDLYPGARDVAAKIVSSRPLTITRQFSDQSPEKVVHTASLLFAACRSAQSIAAAEAFEDALGVEPPASTRKTRAALVLAETAREHALRILMDWPKFLRAPEEADPKLLKSLMQADRKIASAFGGLGELVVANTQAGREAIAELRGFLEHVIFRRDLDEWSAFDRESLTAWAQEGCTVGQRLIGQVMNEGLLDAGAAELSALPALECKALAERLFAAEADAFIARPKWGGSPRETSALSRLLPHPLISTLRAKHGFGLGARLVSCLMELATIPSRIRTLTDAPQPSPETRLGNGRGVAQVEAARGRLIHAVEMDGEKVARYRILAPTEWNFHPSGAVAQGLGRIATGGGDRKACAWLARLFVISADPCVAADVRVH